MKVVIDIECNRLKDPDKIWVIVCKDIDKGDTYVFTNREDFRLFTRDVTLWIGHNLLGYDYPVLRNLEYIDDIDVATCTIDTFIISKMVDFSREGHSIENYGIEFGYPKGIFSDFSKYSKEMEEYCVRDVEICHRIYSKYKRVLNDPQWQPSIQLEHRFQLVCNTLHNNGFYFNRGSAERLLEKVKDELNKLDEQILEAFPPKEEYIRKIRKNKDGSINRVDCRYFDNVDRYKIIGDDLFIRKDFNPSSHKQLVDVLHAAGWNPSDRTKTHPPRRRRSARDSPARRASHGSRSGGTRWPHPYAERLPRPGCG